MLSGHSWVSYKQDGGDTTTYGTWGNNPMNTGNGLHENLEAAKYWPGLCVAFAVFYPVIISCNRMLSMNCVVSKKP